MLNLVLDVMMATLVRRKTARKFTLENKRPTSYLTNTSSMGRGFYPQSQIFLVEPMALHIVSMWEPTVLGRPQVSGCKFSCTSPRKALSFVAKPTDIRTKQMLLLIHQIILHKKYQTSMVNSTQEIEGQLFIHLCLLQSDNILTDKLFIEYICAHQQDESSQK